MNPREAMQDERKSVIAPLQKLPILFSVSLITKADAMVHQNSYTDAYANPNGPGDARPTALQIIRDNGVVNKWPGKVVLITGGNTGIGFETAKAMHATGADVFITARTEEKAQLALSELSKSSEGTGKLDYIVMDMDAFANVRQAAQDFLNKSNKLNILINNAGRGDPTCCRIQRLLRVMS